MFVDNVPERFRAIPKKVRAHPWIGSTDKYLGAGNTLIPWPEYTSNEANKLGFGEHFQGIQRVGRRLVISAGIKNTGAERSQLIVVDMGSTAGRDTWALPKYGFNHKDPSPSDLTVTVFDIDRTKWHAGGIQTVDDIVTVPIYGSVGPGSEIRFFRIGPSSVEPLTGMTLVNTRSQAKAVGIARLKDPSDRFLLVSWDDEYLDLHFSTDLSKGFGERTAHLRRDRLGHGFMDGSRPGAGSYQSVNLVVGTCGAVYLIAGRNTNFITPTMGGEDRLDLYSVRWPGGDYSRNPTLELLNSKQMYCYNQQCNFGAGTGIYVHDEEHLWVYAASHWLHGGNERVNFNEYSYL